MALGTNIDKGHDHYLIGKLSPRFLLKQSLDVQTHISLHYHATYMKLYTPTMKLKFLY